MIVLRVLPLVLLGLAVTAGGVTALPALTHEGRSYVEARQIAAALRGRLEATPERAYLRFGPRSVVFTRDWARVEVDGKPVVLEAPVRVDGPRWLVPEAFMRQVMPLLASPAAAPSVASAPAPAPPVAPLATSGKTSVSPASTPPAAGGGSTPAPPPAAGLPGPSVATPAPVMPPAITPREPRLPEPRLADLRLRSYPRSTRVVLETTMPVRHRVEAPGGKEARVRLLALAAEPRAEAVRDGLVDEVFLAAAGDDLLLRVTFLADGAELRVSTLSDPPRLILDFTRPEIGSRPAAASAGPLRTLVLDAGHGGHDSGAVGPTGLMEKDVVLDVTRRVAALVEARLPGVKVRLSRAGDQFVPLRDRTSFANRERADLFVSIHANAARESVSTGVETFFLSTEATDSAARQVAAVENSVVKLERPSNGRGNRQDAVKNILWDLAQSEYQQESSRLAEVVQDSMTQALRIPSRGVKQAGFYVLGGAAMPAVLIEIGFVTNPREERRLRESKYRDDIAEAIFAGVAEYKRDVDRRASPRAAAR